MTLKDEKLIDLYLGGGMDKISSLYDRNYKTVTRQQNLRKIQNLKKPIIGLFSNDIMPYEDERIVQNRGNAQRTRMGQFGDLDKKLVLGVLTGFF